MGSGRGQGAGAFSEPRAMALLVPRIIQAVGGR